MGTVTYEALIKGVLKFGEKQRELGRFCPFACRDSDGYVCIGRAEAHSGRILVINEAGVPVDVKPNTINNLFDCPVVRDPDSPTIKLD